jgi:predicted enzyme related to lactoylglutathione lyase
VTARFDLVTIDTPDPRRVAVFWCAALELSVVEDEDDGRWLVLADSAGARRIGLQRGVHRAGGVHLDLVCEVDDFASERARLIELGAGEVSPSRNEPYGSIANLADPDGNLFDLCAYT